jgi:radical SAM protein with 4Fe4S-binding SPASM domain
MVLFLYRLLRNNSTLNYLCQRVVAALDRFVWFQKINVSIARRNMLRYQRFPAELALVLTTLCNSDCIMCAYKKARQTWSKSETVMPWDIFRKIIDEAARENPRVQVIFSGGEPLLDPLLYERIEYARKRLPQGNFLLFTNGSLLHKQNHVEKLLRSTLNSITVSVDALSAPEYESIRKNLVYEQLLSNIDELYTQKRRLSAKTLIRVSFLLFRAHRTRYSALIKKMKTSADIVEINSPHNMGGAVEVEANDVFAPGRRYPCKYLWTRMSFPPDGDIAICGFDQFSKTNRIGNISQQSITELWQGQALSNARSQHVGGRYSDIDICAGCTAHASWLKGFFT